MDLRTPSTIILLRPRWSATYVKQMQTSDAICIFACRGKSNNYLSKGIANLSIVMNYVETFSPGNPSISSYASKVTFSRDEVGALEDIIPLHNHK
jgi:hypothetical protein